MSKQPDEILSPSPSPVPLVPSSKHDSTRATGSTSETGTMAVEEQWRKKIMGRQREAKSERKIKRARGLQSGQGDGTSRAHPGTPSPGPPRFQWVPLFFLPVDKLKSSDRENCSEIQVREEGARRQEWKKNRADERGIREEDTNTDTAREGRGWKGLKGYRGSWTTETKDGRKREGDKFRRSWRRQVGRGTERVPGPNVLVTGDVALPDDISPSNYLSVQRDSARRLPVLMPTDNVPILSCVPYWQTWVIDSSNALCGPFVPKIFNRVDYDLVSRLCPHAQHSSPRICPVRSSIAFLRDGSSSLLADRLQPDFGMFFGLYTTVLREFAGNVSRKFVGFLRPPPSSLILVNSESTDDYRLMK